MAQRSGWTRRIASSRPRARRRRARTSPFFAGDLQTADLGGPYYYAFSRFGTMFFANPVVALRNLHGALAPGAPLSMVVWRRKLDNDWLHAAELVVKQYLDKPDETDEPTCGPGPFSMANADTVCDILDHAGFEDIALRRCDRPIVVGGDLDEAVALATALGPAAEVLRLQGERADHIRPRIEAELREAMSAFVQPDGRVVGPASTWIITALRR